MWPEVVCPEDRQSLAIGEGEMVCPRGHHWRNDSGIPRMISQAKNYTDAFGLQWKIYRKTQLDSYTKTTLSLDRARRCLGEECWKMLHRRPRSDVLEVGCGAGRFTEVLISTGAFVTSIDLSSAVEANQENFPQDQHHRILQADLLRLPFAPGQYDVVFCLGVLQHTPNPEEAIKRLYAQVTTAGWLIIDHYSYSLSHFTKSAPLFRRILRRMPPEKGLKWTERLVEIFFPLHRAARKSRIAQALLSRVSPVLSYYHALPLNDDLQRRWSLLDTHDSLTDWYKHFRTKGQIRRVLEGLGGVEIWCQYGGNGVEARCRRPPC
jgi:2-polyprenyl-3-methyl-5-hydroxy-6-metoxy-1,4-benzoquinol methylase